MLYAILCEDRPGSLELRLGNRPAHLEYLDSLGRSLKFAGPFLDADETPAGSMLVVEADSADAARAMAAGDPFAKAGLFAATVVRRWNWTVNNPET